MDAPQLPTLVARIKFMRVHLPASNVLSPELHLFRNNIEVATVAGFSYSSRWLLIDSVAFVALNYGATEAAYLSEGRCMQMDEDPSLMKEIAIEESQLEDALSVEHVKEDSSYMTILPFVRSPEDGLIWRKPYSADLVEGDIFECLSFVIGEVRHNREGIVFNHARDIYVSHKLYEAGFRSILTTQLLADMN